jgi:hypothetical protein
MKHQAQGYDVDITHAILDDSVIEITATSGKHSHVHRITIGAIDTPLPEAYDQVQAQKDLEDARSFAAAMAGSKAKREEIVANLK